MNRKSNKRKESLKRKIQKLQTARRKMSDAIQKLEKSMVNQQLTQTKKPVNWEFTEGRIPKFMLVFREGAVDTIKKQRGWEDDVQMAEALGVTKQQISNVKDGKRKITTDFLLSVAFATGNIGPDSNLGIHFYQPKFIGYYHKNHQRFNYSKFNGEVPYERYSEAAHSRGNGRKKVEVV